MLTIKGRPYVEIGGKERKKPTGIVLKTSVDFWGVTQDEIDALFAFYDATDGDNWTNNTGWKLDPYVGNWFGVTVSGGHVTGISLASNNLDGDPGTTLYDLIYLTSLNVTTNVLTTLDVSKNVLLTELRCAFNSLTSFDPSKNVLLTKLICYNNSLPALDVSKNVLLKDLRCQSNSINGLDLSTNTAIGAVYCGYNSMTETEVDATIASIYGARTNYTDTTPFLDISGVNAAPSATGLGQIQELVYDPSSEGFNTWTINYVDPTYTGADAAEITALIDFYYATGGPYWTDNTNWITATDISTWNGVTTATSHVTNLFLSNNNLIGNADLTNLDWLTSVSGLHINSLTALVISSTLVTTLNFRGNSISAIDISAMVDLINFYGYSNTLTALDASNNIDLAILQAQDNGMSQAAIDSLIDGIYTARNNYTFAGPIAADIGGTNANPSGTYQYAATPSTGEEKRYALENDDDAEGFTLWTIDIT
jgi:hypothetical protein